MPFNHIPFPEKDNSGLTIKTVEMHIPTVTKIISSTLHCICQTEILHLHSIAICSNTVESTFLWMDDKASSPCLNIGIPIHPSSWWWHLSYLDTKHSR